MTNQQTHPYYRNSWALVVGINEYPVSPLSYACNDADAVSAALTGELGFPTEQVTVLKDNAATKQAILSSLYDFQDKASDCDDRLVVFFAGHGTTMQGPRGPIGCLIPVDGTPEKTSSLIRWDDLTRIAELILAKHVLFIMDACYSGLAIQRDITPGSKRFLSDMLQRYSRQVITAGKADQVVADGGGPNGQNSIFTGHLIEGLKGAATDTNGVLTASELMNYVCQKVGQSNQSRQTPHYGHLDGDGDFILRSPNNEHLRKEPITDYLLEAITEIPEIPTQPATVPTGPSYAIKNGYSDPTHPNFGRKDWSSKLVEYRHGKDILSDTPRAFSWLSLICEPLGNQAPTVNIAADREYFSRYAPTGKPYERLLIPQAQTRTSSDSFILYEVAHPYEEAPPARDMWERFLRIDQNGNIEYTTSKEIFFESQGIRTFRYVQIIGLAWQFLFFAKNFLAKNKYFTSARFLLNLVGTRGTVLTDFSKEPGENGQSWRQLFGGFPDENLRDAELHCTEPNLQLVYHLVCSNLDEVESFKVIADIANQLGLAYNHQTEPRCFNYGTNIFPWQQYFSGRH